MEVQREAAERRHHVADPGHLALEDRQRQALYDAVHLQIEGARELDVSRRVPQRDHAERARLSHSVLVRRAFGYGNADHAVAADQRRETLLAPALRSEEHTSELQSQS